MLILYRKKGDSILIGDNITISVMESNTDGVRLAIDAPREVSIFRKELMEAAEVNRESAEISADASQSKDILLKMNEMLKRKERP